jgi:hypothetical protein
MAFEALSHNFQGKAAACKLLFFRMDSVKTNIAGSLPSCGDGLSEGRPQDVVPIYYNM